APFPARDHDVALDPLRPRGPAVRQLALGNAVAPISEIAERHATEVAGKRIDHQRCRLTRLYAPHPCLLHRTKGSEAGWNCTRGKLAQLMTAHARPILNHR